MDQASAIVVDDSSDDNEPPAGMDDASWRLIQRLNGVRDEEAQMALDMELAWNLQRENVNHRTVNMHEKADREVARRLHQEEEMQQQCMREQEDMAIAMQFQIDEEERQRVEARPKHHLTCDEVMRGLKPCQLKAVNYVKWQAKEKHEQSLPVVQKRVETLGFTSEDLEQCMAYIRDDAPIIVHLSEATLSLLVVDTNYRNLFETHTSGGSNNEMKRKEWEASMFGEYYNDSEPHDRPKYGCLNVSGDIQGVPSARHYGTCFMILHQHLRHRTTFFNNDTGGFVPTGSLATNEFYAHVLEGYNDTELKQVLNVCNSARVGGAKSHCSIYKEVQIHGPICLATDIQALSVRGRRRLASEALMKTVEAFQEQSRCNVFWQDDLLDPET